MAKKISARSFEEIANEALAKEKTVVTKKAKAKSVTKANNLDEIKVKMKLLRDENGEVIGGFCYGDGDLPKGFSPDKFMMEFAEKQIRKAGDDNTDPDLQACIESAISNMKRINAGKPRASTLSRFIEEASK